MAPTAITPARNSQIAFSSRDNQLKKLLMSAIAGFDLGYYKNPLKSAKCTGMIPRLLTENKAHPRREPLLDELMAQIFIRKTKNFPLQKNAAGTHQKMDIEGYREYEPSSAFGVERLYE